MNYAQKLETIQEKIQKSNTSNYDIKLIAVSKSVTSKEVLSMSHFGQLDFGENRVQSLKQKVDDLKDLNLNWHFIGRLQTNKINQLIDLNPILWHSCDSLKRAIEFDKRLKIKDKSLDCLLQINSANEDEKQGVSPLKAEEIYHQIQSDCKNLNLKGVMSIGAFSDDKKKIEKSFEITYKVFENIKGARFCSMGMSNDFELAIKCGANMLRIGSILFH